MAENRASGPQIGQVIIYTPTPGTSYPAMTVDVNNTSGLVRLTTFAPGGATADQQNVSYDGTRTVAGTWSWPNTQSGV